MIDSPEGDSERHVDLVDTSRPLTRDLTEIVRAAYVMEAELRHQIARLQNVKPRTESEGQHTEQLRNGYLEAFHNVRVLRRYHEGRLYRQRTTGDTAPSPTSEQDDAATLVFGSGDDDPHGAYNG